MRILTWVVVTLLVFGVSLASAEEMKHWKRVGGDPYRCKTCTPEWALAHSGYPEEVQELALEMIKNRQGMPGMITGGQVLDWETFGQNKPGIFHNVLADWPRDVGYETDFFAVDFDGKEYVVTYTHKCGNYGGFTRPMDAYIAPAPAAPDVYPAGGVPSTSCGGSSACSTCN